MGTGSGGGAASVARAARASGLQALRESLALYGERVCRWPPCDRPAASVGTRGPDGQGPGGSGGRRPEFCSEAHQRATARAVRGLQVLLDEALALRACAPVREHKAIDATVAEVRHRLALHGEPAPATPTPATATAAASVVASPADGGVVVALRPAGDPAPVRPVALELRGDDQESFRETWEWLRDAADATRRHSRDLQSHRDPAGKRAVVAAAWPDYAELAEAVEELLLAAVRPWRPRGRRP